MKFYKSLWLSLYIFANLIAASIFFLTAELDGDLIGYPLPNIDVLIIATFSVIISYIIWMGPVFKMVSSLKIRQLPFLNSTIDSLYEERFTGIFVLVIQTFFLFFNLVEGVNVSGSKLQSESSIRYLWIFFAPDALFLVFYGLHRKSKLFLINIFVFIISNSLRGWLSTWLFIFFIEGAYRIRERRLNFKKVFIALIIFLLVLPILIELKWTIRELGATTIHNASELFERFTLFVTNFNWWESFKNSIRPIVMRFQHLASVIGIIDNADVISSGLANREFLYFFEEGLPQYTFLKIFGRTVPSDIHNMLLTYLIPYQLPVDTITNTHVGLVGWFWISPILFPFYLVYLLFLLSIGIWLSKKLQGNGLLIDIIWFVCLVYLMNGWLGSYIQFLQALFIILVLRKFIKLKFGIYHRKFIIFKHISPKQY